MAATEQLHPDDRPPEPGARRGIPRGLLWALALAVVVLTVASWVALSNESATKDDVTKLGNGSPGLDHTDTDLVGKDAPGFTLPSLTGADIASSDLRGAPVLVNFWASNCGPCVEEMPALEKLHKRYGDKVKFVGVSSGDLSKTAATDMVAKTGVTYPSVWDAAGQTLMAFGTYFLPSTYLIDADGIVRYQHTSGAVPMDELSAALDRLTG